MRFPRFLAALALACLSAACATSTPPLGPEHPEAPPLRAAHFGVLPLGTIRVSKAPGIDITMQIVDRQAGITEVRRLTPEGLPDDATPRYFYDSRGNFLGIRGPDGRREIFTPHSCGNEAGKCDYMIGGQRYRRWQLREGDLIRSMFMLCDPDCVVRSRNETTLSEDGLPLRSQRLGQPEPMTFEWRLPDPA